MISASIDAAACLAGWIDRGLPVALAAVRLRKRFEYRTKRLRWQPVSTGSRRWVPVPTAAREVRFALLAHVMGQSSVDQNIDNYL
ncbi:hypothetical protein [Micromonospora pisi]|uniref:hypothetical protein n=1 Tax=Micromonospora pisi TaxID=589240 RepID=UPI0011C3B705|nr:hypothetical protein [Micromonospora pisi]